MVNGVNTTKAIEMKELPNVAHWTAPSALPSLLRASRAVLSNLSHQGSPRASGLSQCEALAETQKRENEGIFTVLSLWVPHLLGSLFSRAFEGLPAGF